eukprot:803831-Alexandrium_andersonii.AAC.1
MVPELPGPGEPSTIRVGRLPGNHMPLGQHPKSKSRPGPRGSSKHRPPKVDGWGSEFGVRPP